MAYYLLLSSGTFGAFKQSTTNFVRLLNQMSAEIKVGRQEGSDGAELL
jgi:hypothetical protein